jgi:aspartate beta-hydroxylase
MSVAYDLSSSAVRWLYDRRISDPAVLRPGERFPGAGRFVDLWPELRAEAMQLAQDLGQVPRFHELMAEQESISANDGRDWRVFVLKAYGVPFKSNLARCPTLAALVKDDPDVLSATLSFLAPGKHIPSHRGPFRGILRFYLGLSVPVGDDGLPETALTIDGKDHRIGDGQHLLWDDTFPHEVQNHSAKPRIALLLDVRRRDMPWDMEFLSRLLIAAVRGAIRLRRLA